MRDLDEQSKRKLQVGKVYVNESLCPSLKYLFGVCNALYKKKHISKNYFYNGNLHIIMPDEEKQAIGHMNDLYDTVGHDMMKNVLKEFKTREIQ